MIILGSTFSLQMLPKDANCNLSVEWISKEEASNLLANEYISAVGHESTAAALSILLGRNVQMNRIQARLTNEDILIVGQLVSGRLPEGCTTLPEDAKFAFAKVTLQS